jgi:hypothetical protein
LIYGTCGHRDGISVVPVVAAATASVDGVFVDWVDFYEAPRTTFPAGRRWLTGTGNVGQLNGDGNRDIYVSANTAHPSDAGYAYVATRFAQTIRPPATGLDY